MQQAPQQPSTKLVFAIQKARNGGYTCVLGPDADGEELDCSVTGMPELFEWMARTAGGHFQDMPYRPQPLQLNRPAEPTSAQPPPQPHRQPAGAAPPPLPPEPEPPLPPGIVPDRATRGLMDALQERMAANGRGLAAVPLLACLAIAQAWPFGA